MTLGEAFEGMRPDVKVLILRGEDKALFYGTVGQSGRFFARSAERARRLGVVPYEDREARLLTITEDGLFIYKIAEREKEETGNAEVC